MLTNDPPKEITTLFQSWCGEEPNSCAMLPIAGSDRRYYRVSSQNHHAVACVNPDVAENHLFTSLCQYFGALKAPVPTLFSVNQEHTIYLQQDLGDQSLLKHLIEQRENGLPSLSSITLYKKSLSALAKLQIGGLENTPVPLEQFEAGSMIFDLHYFKYYFVKAHKIPLDEPALERDFQAITSWLSNVRGGYLLYRDFQARNIMVFEEEPWFIDFQGVKSGPLAYDVASLLFQAKAELPPNLREELLDFYLSELSILDKSIDIPNFKKFYHGFVLMRLLQVLGSYGFRGLFEGRRHFLESIPYGLKNLKWWRENVTLPFPTPELDKITAAITTKEFILKY